MANDHGEFFHQMVTASSEVFERGYAKGVRDTMREKSGYDAGYMDALRDMEKALSVLVRGGFSGDAA